MWRFCEFNVTFLWRNCDAFVKLVWRLCESCDKLVKTLISDFIKLYVIALLINVNNRMFGNKTEGKLIIGHKRPFIANSQRIQKKKVNAIYWANNWFIHSLMGSKSYVWQLCERLTSNLVYVRTFLVIWICIGGLKSWCCKYAFSRGKAGHSIIIR